MIIETLTLHNFGAYRGKQTIELLPPSPEKPVILFGGLNGVGKTTLLDSIQLVLYGKLARCSNRNGQSYENFLKSCIHNSAEKKEGAALEIQFNHWSEGKKNSYRVKRAWFPNGKGLKEQIEVIRDGDYDTIMTEYWAEQVEEFMPQNLSHLFLFDGEKIKDLADMDSSSELLNHAVHSLLGLDLVDRLVDDLGILERRKKEGAQDKETQNQIDKLNTLLTTLDAEWTEVHQVLGKANNTANFRETEFEELDRQFQQEGGRLFEQREALEAEHKQRGTELNAIEDELREVAAGPLPFLLIQDLLQETVTQSQQETKIRQARAISQVLNDRDTQLLQKADELNVPEEALRILADYLAFDRQQYTQDAQRDCYLELTQEKQQLLQGVFHTILLDSRSRASRLLESHHRLSIAISELARKLSRVPDDAAIGKLVAGREAAKMAWDEAREHAALLAARLNAIGQEIQQQKEKLKNLYKKQKDKELAARDGQRIVQYSQNMRQTLRHFRKHIVQRHITRIEQYILSCYQQLLRKQTLVYGLNIDPNSFSLTLWDDANQRIDPERLSAGERQLLAISILWGLCRASGKSLPTVIDTPLSRLDSIHRTHLIERYFPHASHQVLLLSTDEEVSDRYYEQLKPWIGHAYHLNYDDREKMTRIERGYFWEES